MMPMTDITEKGDIGSGQVLEGICWLCGALCPRGRQSFQSTPRRGLDCASTLVAHSWEENRGWWCKCNHPRIMTKLGCRDHVKVFGSIQLLSHVWLFATPWTAAHQASLSITNSQSPSKPMSIESVMPPNHLILCHPLLLLPSIFPSIRVFSNESTIRTRDQIANSEWNLTIQRNKVLLHVLIVVQSLRCVQFYDPMDSSMPGFPILHYLLEFTRIHVHWVSDAV